MRGNHLIREARKRAGITQAELARRAGTTQSVISRLENGTTTPSLETISDLVRACGFDVTIHVAPTDNDHNWSLLQQNLRLSPLQRLRQLRKTIQFVDDLKTAGRVVGTRSWLRS